MHCTSGVLNAAVSEDRSSGEKRCVWFPCSCGPVAEGVKEECLMKFTKMEPDIFFSLRWRSKRSRELLPWRAAFRSFPVDWRFWINKCFHLFEFCRFDATRPLTSCCGVVSATEARRVSKLTASKQHLNSSQNTRERRTSALTWCAFLFISFGRIFVASDFSWFLNVWRQILLLENLFCRLI